MNCSDFQKLYEHRKSTFKCTNLTKIMGYTRGLHELGTSCKCARCKHICVKLYRGTCSMVTSLVNIMDIAAYHVYLPGPGSNARKK